MEYYIKATHCECKPPLPVVEQIAWTLGNPGRRFKACPIYVSYLAKVHIYFLVVMFYKIMYSFILVGQAHKMCIYVFTDVELPNEFYKDLFFKLKEENKRLKKMEKSAISTEVVDGSIKVVALSNQLKTMKEDISFIKAKVQFYDKFFLS